MREQLISYIEYLFEDAPDGTQELKGEITANCLDRYDEMIANGKSEQAAFNTAAGSIGDVKGLFAEFSGTPAADRPNPAVDRAADWRALLLPIAVALYIMSFIPTILLDSDIGPCLMFVMWAVATALIIFRATAFKGKELNNVSQAVHKAIAKDEESGALCRAVTGALWAVGVALYFILSFATGAWHITWLVFVIFAAFSNIVRLLFSLRR